MCFNIHPKFKEPKVAAQDITCYKVFEKEDIKENTVRSLHMRFKYIFGLVYNAEFEVRKSLHEMSIIEDGFHSYINKFLFKFKWNRPCLPCIIPKGAQYYINPDSGEYCSNQIILKKPSKWVLFKLFIYKHT